MIPTVEQVYTRARRLLSDGDEVQVGGEQWTDAVLAGYFNSGYEKLYSEMANYGIKRSEVIIYPILPAYTTVMSPKQAGVNNMGETVRMAERNQFTFIPIIGSSVDPDGSTIILRVPATSTPGTPGTPGTAGFDAFGDVGFGEGGFGDDTGGTPGTPGTPGGPGPAVTPPGWAEIFVAGVQGELGANGRWFAELMPPDQVKLRGSESEGAWSSGGAIYWGDQAFSSMQGPVQQLPRLPPVDRLIAFTWMGDKWRFIGATIDVQLEITYLASGTAPVAGLVGIDDSLNVLAHYVAGKAAREDGQYELADKRDNEHELFLAKWLQSQVKHLPSARPKAFRRRRSWGRRMFGW